MIFQYLLSIPKSIYFCFKTLPFQQAVRLPILIHHSTKLSNISGKVILHSIHPAIVKIGFAGSYGLGLTSKAWISNQGTLVFKGKCNIGRGAQLIIGGGGTISFGDRFRCNSNCIINANSYIYFGDDCLLSWNDTILDSDGHSILNSEHVCCNQTKPIYFGNHVWICSDTTILKGASVSDGSVIAAHSTISKEIDEKNVVIGGVNKIVSHNINWEE